MSNGILPWGIIPFCVSFPGDANQLDLGSSLFVGSVDYMDTYLRLPPTLWSGTLRHGFVGCLKELFINGAAYDLVAYAHQQDVGEERRKERPRGTRGPPLKSGN